jgi:hypothetical protein
MNLVQSKGNNRMNKPPTEWEKTFPTLHLTKDIEYKNNSKHKK